MVLSFFCFCIVCLGYNFELNKGKRKFYKYVKWDEVVLFDNVKEYSYKLGKWNEKKKLYLGCVGLVIRVKMCMDMDLIWINILFYLNMFNNIYGLLVMFVW